MTSRIKLIYKYTKDNTTGGIECVNIPTRWNDREKRRRLKQSEMYVGNRYARDSDGGKSQIQIGWLRTSEIEGVGMSSYGAQSST